MIIDGQTRIIKEEAYQVEDDQYFVNRNDRGEPIFSLSPNDYVSPLVIQISEENLALLILRPKKADP